MVTSEQRLDYLKTRIKYNCIGGLITLPMLVLMWWLDYKIIVALIIALEFMSGWGMGQWIVKQEDLLGINEE